jgi:hypothetical protein
MKMGLRKDADWEYVGAKLARADDEEQTAFFKAFCKECSKWGTSAQVEWQIAGINAKLTKEERETLSMLSYMEE